jgi:hypothetical protein
MTSDIGNIVETTSKQEASAYAAFMRTYRLEHPEPKKPSIQIASLLSWEFYASMIVATCAVLLAAARTAPTFYQIAVNDGYSGAFAFISGTIALIAVEGMMFVGAMIRASKKGKNSWSLSVAEGIAFIISMIAGLSFTFNAFDLLTTYASNLVMWLALVIGVGATVLAWAAGDIVGSQISASRKMSNEIDAKYREDYKVWSGEVTSHWMRSDERKIARGEIHSLVSKQPRTNERTNERTRRTGNGTNEVRERIFSYLNDERARDPNHIPGPTEIASALNVSKSHASIVLREWRGEA